jgi:hypothetical protein
MTQTFSSDIKKLIEPYTKVIMDKLICINCVKALYIPKTVLPHGHPAGHGGIHHLISLAHPSTADGFVAVAVGATQTLCH